MADSVESTTRNVADLIGVVDRLRSPGGCPWDAEQTHTSLVKYLVEETYEVVDAISADSPAALKEELGDLLLQVVFHARIAQENPNEPFGMEDVAAGIAAKMRRRHPHVFGDATVRDAAEVADNWQRIKAEEKQRAHPLDDIPHSLPALARAAKFHDRLGDEHAEVVDGSDLGARLFDLVRQGRRAGLDPESCLREHLDRIETNVAKNSGK